MAIVYCNTLFVPYIVNVPGAMSKIVIINWIVFNPKMDMQKIVTLDGFGVRVDPRDHFGKNATLNKSQV